MNKTDIIKIGLLPPPPSLPLLSLSLWGERRTRTSNDVVLLSLSHTLLLFLLLPDCLSVPPPFTHLTLHPVSPRGCEAWLSTEAELSRLRGSAKEKSRRQTRAEEPREGCLCVFVWVCACVCVGLCVCWWVKHNCHTSAYWATWSQINREIMRPHTVGRAMKTQDRDTEEQIESESRTGAKLGDKVLTAGLFDSVWQQCERMDLWVDGSCVLVMLFVQGHSVELGYSTDNIFLPSLWLSGFEWIFKGLITTRISSLQISGDLFFSVLFADKLLTLLTAGTFESMNSIREPTELQKSNFIDIKSKVRGLIQDFWQ